MTDKFTIASWPVDTQLQLCRVPWDVAYKDVVQFASPADRAAYFAGLDSESITLERLTYCKMGEPIRINIPFADCYNYNYLVVSNPKLPTDGVTPPVLYYFVTGIAFNSPNTTILTVALDVWQTYLFTEDGGAGFELGYSFLQRGHWPMKKVADATTWSGGTSGEGYPVVTSDVKRHYLLAPEGLEQGNEYVISNREYVDLAHYDHHSGEVDAPWSGEWTVLILSSTSLAKSWGTVDSPSLKTPNGNDADGLAGGCGLYAIPATQVKDLMRELAECPWISSGILSITAFPTRLINFGTKLDLNAGDSHVLCYTVKGSKSGQKFTETGSITAGFLPLMLTTLDNAQYFTKLFTYPFTMIQLSNRNGTVLNLKPEMFKDDSVYLRSYCCCVPGNIRVGLAVSKYGSTSVDTSKTYQSQTLDGTTKDVKIYDGLNLDAAMWFDNFPQLSIVNDGYLSYLAGTTHSRQYAYDSASWGYERSSMGVNNMLNQTELSLQTAESNRQIANQTAITGAAIGAVASVAGGVSSGASGGIAGAVLGGLGGASSAAVSIAQTANALNGANLQFANNQAQVSQSAGMNAAYQNRANAGDYQNAIAGINAKVQDAALTQPSVSGANGGNGFALSNNLMGLDIRWMCPHREFVFNICNYWGRYGYAYNKYVKPGSAFNLGNFYTYWKMQDVYLTAAQADEGSKDVIRAVFEKGVTVWSDPAIIGNVSPLDNVFK